MYVKSLFIQCLLFCCFTSSLGQSAEENETTEKRGREKAFEDINHPGNLIQVHNLQWFYGEGADSVEKRINSCYLIDSTLKPKDLDPTQLELFLYDYREWWAIFKYSKSGVIKKMKQRLQNYAGAVAHEQQAALISRLNRELCRIADWRTVYDSCVVVKESDVESIIHALKLWGLSDKRLLTAARVVHRAWHGGYSDEAVEWPQNCGNSTKPL